MSSRKSYNRFFIILQEDQKGYGLDSNKTPSGYAKLEVRNDRVKTSFYVQNLKQQKGPYFMILIVQGKNDKELINLGQINIDNGGKADVSNEFDANNLANTNIGMDSVQGAAIGRISADKVMPVMVGFTGGEELKNWQKYPLAKSNGNTVKENKNITKSVKETPKSHNENMNKVMPKIENTNLGKQENKSGVTTNSSNQAQIDNPNMTQQQTGASNTTNPALGTTINESGNPMGSINPSMGDMNSNIDNLNKTLINPALGTTINESGNPMGSINPSMGDMNSNMDNLNKTLSNPSMRDMNSNVDNLNETLSNSSTMNINNPKLGTTINDSGNPSMDDMNSDIDDLNKKLSNPSAMNINNSELGTTINDSGNPMGSINPGMRDMNSNVDNINKTLSNPSTMNINNLEPGTTINESGNSMDSINPSMDDMNSNMDNINKTLSNPSTMNINNPELGTTINESVNLMSSIDPSMRDMNRNIDNLNKTLSNPSTININNSELGTTINESGNSMSSIDLSMRDMNRNIDNINKTLSNPSISYKHYIDEEVDIIDIEEVESVVKDNVIKDELEINDRNYIEDENRIFEEYEKEIERLKDYRKKHSKKKNKYDDDDCKIKKQQDCEKIKSNKKYGGDCKSDKNKKCQWNDNDYPVGAKGKFFKEVVYGLEKMGSNENIKNCFWYKAHIKKLEDMYCVYDYNKYSVVFYPMICYYPYISRHGNFMVGYKCNDEGELKYIIYAIPGTRSLSDQPYEGKTGFVTFMPNEDDDKMGHWLMYYDIKGNTVVVPVKR